jgi:ATP-dependent protease HslVU (ClpYQ) peptidase subunit
MTTIAARKEGRRIRMAADSRLSGSLIYPVREMKLIERPGFLIGVGGPCLVTQHFGFALATETESELLAHDKASIAFGMLHLHRVMCDTALLNPEYEATHAAESHVQVMIANAAGLFFVTEDRAVLGPLDYWAFGKGRDFALGALKVGASPKEAVLAAAHFDPATDHHLIERSFEYGGDFTPSEETLRKRREMKMN